MLKQKHSSVTSLLFLETETKQKPTQPPNHPPSQPTDRPTDGHKGCLEVTLPIRSTLSNSHKNVPNNSTDLIHKLLVCFHESRPFSSPISLLLWNMCTFYESRPFSSLVSLLLWNKCIFYESRPLRSLIPLLLKNMRTFNKFLYHMPPTGHPTNGHDGHEGS